MNTFTLRRRMFLAPASTGVTSYIFAEVESSHGGRYKYGHYMLSLADCHRCIDLEFSLATAHLRRRSLAKISLLIDVLIEFRERLAAEAKLIASSDQKGDETGQTTKRPSTKKRK
jgi:hypothetical protein